MKAMIIRFRGKAGDYGQPFIVKETNKFFKWYKDSVYYEKLKEFDLK
jgi:hypothetical protein